MTDAVDTALAELAPTRRRPAARSLRKLWAQVARGRRDKVIAARAQGFSHGAIRAALEQCGETADEDGAGNDPSRPGGNARALLSAVHFDF
ncbi:MAG: hypothetical protein ACLRRT_01795 [Ruthenibacterium lactatiformans]